jgi:hypothetical protein
MRDAVETGHVRADPNSICRSRKRHGGAGIGPGDAQRRSRRVSGRPAEHIARFVPVTLGITTSDRAEVLDPSLSGEVVTLGIHLVVDGAPITIPEQPGRGGLWAEQT